MPLTKPNYAAATYPAQAEWFQCDWDALVAAIGGVTGVLTGCAVTTQGAVAGRLSIAAGDVVVGGAFASVASGTVDLAAPDVTNPRIDIVVADNAGAKSKIDGTAASSPVPPALPTNRCLLAEVYVPAAGAAAVINANQITDCRCNTFGIKVDVYSAAGSYTWTKPAWANEVDVYCIGSGGGGGSGRKGATSTLRQGGGAGGGGGLAQQTFRASDLAATVGVTVGAKGTGGPAQATAATDGTAGGNGSSSYFGDTLLGAIVRARQGNGGNAGSSAGTPAGGPAGFTQFTGGDGGGASITAGTGGAGAPGSGGAGGGGGGGGVTAANGTASGGLGGVCSSRAGTTAPVAGTGGAPGTAGAAGSTTTPSSTNSPVPGDGGAGGGSGTTAGGNGGDGVHGSGGGGGGASTTGNSGKGGDGGDGIVVVISRS